MKFKHLIATSILVFFLLPIATAFCCCTDFHSELSREQTLGHHHGSSESGHDHASHHQHGKEKKASSDSCECGSEILGDLANRAPDLNFSNAHLLNYQTKQLFTPLATIKNLRQSDFSFQDTGPPGISSTSTPLFLRLSVLRI